MKSIATRWATTVARMVQIQPTVTLRYLLLPRKLRRGSVAKRTPREQERVMSEMKLSEHVRSMEPDLGNVALDIADDIEALEAKLSKVEDVLEAAANWNRAHPNPEGHCDNDDLRMCVTGRALKEALMDTSLL